MNKNLTFIVLLLFTCFSVNAQTQKGSQLLGGGVLFGITNGTSNNVNTINNVYTYSYKSK